MLFVKSTKKHHYQNGPGGISLKFHEDLNHLADVT